MKKGETTLPLHGGKAPHWLFQRMIRLGRAVARVIIDEYGPQTLLERLSNPYWFQAFGCALGFDWHSSGLTTTVCGALKEGLSGMEEETGIYICGGKGKRSRKTPGEVTDHCVSLGTDPSPLVYASRMSAKVDNTALQDGYQLYHHNFFFLEEGTWCVIQQGMNDDNGMARRYHWLSDSVDDFVCEPQNAVCSQDHPAQKVLNMVAEESDGARSASTELSRNQPDRLVTELIKYELPRRHNITRADLNPSRLITTFEKAYEQQPESYEQLLGVPGVGSKSIRALSLLSEIMFGEEPSFEDPARYSFAHGGKDGIPYPVNKKTYDRSIEFLEEMVNRSELEPSDRRASLKKLAKLKTPRG